MTERTPLTRSTDAPNYPESCNVLRPRRIGVSQFQCCAYATFTAILAMALVTTIGYLARTTDPRAGDVLRAARPATVATLPRIGLTDDERRLGLLAGSRAMDDRRAADAEATLLPAIPSANFRHRHAVETSTFAGRLALAGIGEIAATREIEATRNRLGRVSSIGIYFDAGWVPEGGCREYARVDCTASKYRTYDGTCNHARQWGSSLTAFRRALPPDYADGIDAPRRGRYGTDLPSAREVSLRVHPPSPSENPSFTVMLAVFGQFLDHDVTATAISQTGNGSSLACCPPSTGHPECFPVDAGDGSCMEFVRSAPAPQCRMGPRQQLNQVSAFVDASVIYGPDSSQARRLRAGKAGLLEMQLTPDNRTLLPPSTDPNDGCNRKLENARGRYCFVAGDGRANENLHLTTMHLLWARQHNRMATSLARVNPSWDDERLYDEARRVVIAQLQHIAYREFVPIILGERETNRRQLKPRSHGYRTAGYDPRIDPTIGNNFATAAFRFAHTLLPGLMRVTDAAIGTSHYLELRKMLFDPYSLYASGGVASAIIAAVTNPVQATSTHVTSQLTRHLFEADPTVANNASACGLDLVSLNVQRGRDHGLPSYTAWREYCGLTRPTDFAELAPHLHFDALEQISRLYAHVDDVDLYTGALAETVASDGILGPTFTCLLADQFTRLQRGDRYWYETAEQPQAFTGDQLRELRKSSLAKLICDCSDQVTRIQPEVMRSVGPDNPTLPCNDIPGPSMEAWREEASAVAVGL